MPWYRRLMWAFVGTVLGAGVVEQLAKPEQKAWKWRYIKAVFRHPEKLETRIVSIVGNGPREVLLNSVGTFLYEKYGGGASEANWKCAEVIHDLPWMSSGVLWEDGKTVDQMYKEW